jgi:hypothetical protein
MMSPLISCILQAFDSQVLKLGCILEKLPDFLIGLLLAALLASNVALALRRNSELS